MYLLVTSRKGISSIQLSKEIGVTQKSAWFMLHRLREACGPDIDQMGGEIEIDETYVGAVSSINSPRLGTRPIMKHYVSCLTFRLNQGNCERHTLDRIDSLIDGVTGKRLTYKELTS
jgi:hypothetical protein